MTKEVQAKLKSLCDGIINKTKNGPRSVYWDKINAVYKDCPTGGLADRKMEARPKEFLFYGIYDARIQRDALYYDFGVKVKK